MEALLAQLVHRRLRGTRAAERAARSSGAFACAALTKIVQSKAHMKLAKAYMPSCKKRSALGCTASSAAVSGGVCASRSGCGVSSGVADWSACAALAPSSPPPAAAAWRRMAAAAAAAAAA